MTLKAARELPHRRIVALFQPHRYTRTKDLFQEFMTAFYDADILVVTDIYPAGEAPLPGVSGRQLYDGLKQYNYRDVTYTPEIEQAQQHVAGLLQAGDVFITLGAGNIWTAGEGIMQRRAERSGV
jgi:UDP-N-acetylmuramate--alanine ligase